MRPISPPLAVHGIRAEVTAPEAAVRLFPAPGWEAVEELTVPAHVTALYGLGPCPGCGPCATRAGRTCWVWGSCWRGWRAVPGTTPASSPGSPWTSGPARRCRRN